MNLQQLDKNSEFIYRLLSIRELLPSSIIAGGWLRDLYHNKQFNDIDIYVTEYDQDVDIYDENVWKKIFKLNIVRDEFICPYEYIRDAATSEVGHAYSTKNHINMVWEISAGGTLYNIIILDMDPIEYINNYFDIGLCKIYCDGKKIRLTSDFMHDSKNKELNLVSKKLEQDEFNYVMNKHIPKLRSKYHGYALIVPEMYQEWYQDFTNAII